MKPQELKKLINRTFNESELKNLCFDLEIDYENLSGNNKSEKIRELILFCQRHNRISELLNNCERLRPNESWKIDNSLISLQSSHKRSRLWVVILSIAALFIIGVIIFTSSISELYDIDKIVTPTEIAVAATSPKVSAETFEPITILESTPNLTASQPSTSLITPTNIPREIHQTTPTIVTSVNYTPTVQKVNGYEYVLIPPKANDNGSIKVNEFWLGTYEVTNLWFANYLNGINPTNQCSNGHVCIDSNASNVRVHRKNGQWVVDIGYENHPVTEVTWYGASDYCKAIEGRLPNNVEWLHAASWNPILEQEMNFPWGDHLPSQELANYNNFYNDTRPVGTYSAGRSITGVYDMLGNVWEFVANTQGINRMALGGGWDTSENQIIIGISYTAADNTTDSNLGFRCAQ